MASRSDGYWSRSLDMLTREKGWYKPILVLGAASLVPIVGILGVLGYAVEWGRLTAWGVDAAPKQRGVDVGACIKSGARAFVVAFVYGLVITFVNGLIRRIFGGTFGGLLTAVLGAFASIVTLIAYLRATIYQRIGAGFQVDRIIDMIKRDTNGFLRVVGLGAILSFAVGAVMSFLLGILLVSQLGTILPELSALGGTGASSYDDWQIMRIMLIAFSHTFPSLCVLLYVLCVGSVFQQLVVVNATALWMRQFDVPNWGESSDPLPGSAPAATPEAATWVPGAPQQTAAVSQVPDLTPSMQQVPQAQDVSAAAPVQEIPQPVDPLQVSEEPVVPVASVEPEAVEEVTPRAFVLDDAPVAAAGADEPPMSFTLDDAPVAAEPVDEAPSGFTLDDDSASAEQEDAAPTGFTFDDLWSSDEQVSEEPTGFTLDDAAEVDAAPEAFTLESAPAPKARTDEERIEVIKKNVEATFGVATEPTEEVVPEPVDESEVEAVPEVEETPEAEETPEVEPIPEAEAIPEMEPIPESEPIDEPEPEQAVEPDDVSEE